MIDPMRLPSGDIADLYGHRWEIRLGYREQKKYMLGSRLTLRSRLPELVKHELWGILLKVLFYLLDVNIKRPFLLCERLSSINGKERFGDVTQEDVLAFSQILGIPNTLATKQLHLIASSIYDESSILTDKLNNYLIVQRELTN
jgi:hypothetical protein